MSEEYYDDDYESGGWALRAVLVATVLAGLVAALWVGVNAFGSEGASQSLPPTDTAPALDGVAEIASPDSTDPAESDSAEPGDQPDAEEAADAEEALESAEVSDASTSPEPPPTGDANAANITSPSVLAPSYEILPDGRPVPALVIFDDELITLSGAVPSQDAADRLNVLALANSTAPGAEVASFLTIDPTVPIGLGVRVIEMNSARFPEGSPAISPAHAEQLDRVVAIMTALPNISAEIIGHSDQRGDDATNFALSTERARVAADYLAAAGVDPTRLSSRGAGESDLLTLNNDDAALALNRRTEFVFYGLLVDDAAPG